MNRREKITALIGILLVAAVCSAQIVPSVIKSGFWKKQGSTISPANGESVAIGPTNSQTQINPVTGVSTPALRTSGDITVGDDIFLTSEYAILGYDSNTGIRFSSIETQFSMSTDDYWHFRHAGIAQEVLTITTSGKMGLGTQALADLGDGAKTFVFATGATPTTTPSPGFVALVVAGVTQTFTFGTDGTFNQLSSHDPETGQRWTNEFNIYTGIGERVYKDGTVKTYTVQKINPEASYKEAWKADYITKNTISVPSVDGKAATVIVPTLEEAQTAANKDYKFEWTAMPKYVRDAWGK